MPVVKTLAHRSERVVLAVSMAAGTVIEVAFHLEIRTAKSVAAGTIYLSFTRVGAYI